ncbi:MAG: UPF0182 family protein, partial [Acidimicrobiales bacterium]
MRVPSEPAPPVVHTMRRYQIGILVAIIVIVLAIIALQAVANLFTNYVWYRSVGLTSVWRAMVGTKLELGGVFSGAMFLATWVSLVVVDRIAPRALFMSPELELVRRYQSSIGRHRLAVRLVVSLLVGLAVGAGTTGQWQHWLLFLHGGTFGFRDAQFHRDVGYYVFKLPFISFLVDWLTLALVVLGVVSAVDHYLNGGLRFSGPSPRVDPRTTAHLSAILAALALVRGLAYFYVDRYGLDLSNNGIVTGAGYTDVHVRLPGLELLAIVSFSAFVLLVYNIYYRSWLLPAVGVGLWAFLAIVAGLIFPEAVQLLQVNPTQSTAELPYVERNIAATRFAMGLNTVRTQSFKATSDLSAALLSAPNNAPTLESVSYWDPVVAGDTFQKNQANRGFYDIAGVSAERYVLGTGTHAVPTPVVIGVRQVRPNQLPNPTWVNVHLQYTHGFGYVISPANTYDKSGNPIYYASDLPPRYSHGAPRVQGKYRDVYFGVGMSGYSVVDTKQPEVDYPTGPGQTKTSSYEGSGGIKVGGFWTRAAFALRFHDFNLLASKLITPKSRIMMIQDVRQRVQRAAPFLRVDSHPYPVVADGQIWWIVDCYTTSDYYPYGQTADNSALGPSSGLGGSFNYVRDSVKAVVNAYSGAVSFYAVDGHDPVLRTWERTFPRMFQPIGHMLPALRKHLRYPQDLLTVQAAMYGRYHVAPSDGASFYANSDAWSLASNYLGQGASPVLPIYEMLRLPGQSASSLGFVGVEPLVPYARNGGTQTLSAFMVASSSGSGYGHLTTYEIPREGKQVQGPALVLNQIQGSQTVSRTITQLDQHGSRVVLGPTVMIPIDSSLLYVRTLYLRSVSFPAPLVQDVIVDYDGRVAMAPTLLGRHGALSMLFGQAVSAIGSGGQGSISPLVRQLLHDAVVEYGDAQT